MLHKQPFGRVSKICSTVTVETSPEAFRTWTCEPAGTGPEV
jgi:hypothetical protein